MKFAKKCPSLNIGHLCTLRVLPEVYRNNILGVSKKHQNWKFHDAPKECGYTSPGNPKTP